MQHNRSPFAMDFPQIPKISGVRLATAHSGMRYRNRDDILLVELAEGTQVAGVFTSNQMPGVPVDWCREILIRGTARGLVVNAGMANVFTGTAGRDVVEGTAQSAATLLGCNLRDVYISSTGTIGVLPSLKHIQDVLPRMHENLADAGWENAAQAIMTTDTFAKGAVRQTTIGNTKVTLAGIVKGSGMIAPNMATMLGYIFTDAAIPAPVLQTLLTEGADRSFNCITVDGDTSTSDTVLLFATGKATHITVQSAQDEVLKSFRESLFNLMEELARAVVRDGEGLTKFVTIEVKGAENDASARRIGLAIANSPLVKTALAGQDANWGRLVAAIGKSGEQANRDRTSIWFGEVMVAENGEKHPKYKEEDGAAEMKCPEIRMRVDVGVGPGKATVWTTDLTHGYISINADYRS